MFNEKILNYFKCPKTESRIFVLNIFLFSNFNICTAYNSLQEAQICPYDKYMDMDGYGYPQL